MADGFKQRYEEHMMGRNGADAISRLCLVVALVLVVLSFATVGVSPILYVLVLVLGIGLAVYAVLRMNSRNVAARRAENEAFWGLFNRSGKEGREPREPREPRQKREKADRVRERRSVRDRDRDRDRGEEQDAPGQDREPAADSGSAEPQAAPAKVTVTCDSCGQRLSVPSGKGNIRITCPKCQNRFTTHT